MTKTAAVTKDGRHLSPHYLVMLAHHAARSQNYHHEDCDRMTTIGEIAAISSSRLMTGHRSACSPTIKSYARAATARRRGVDLASFPAREADYSRLLDSCCRNERPARVPLYRRKDCMAHPHHFLLTAGRLRWIVSLGRARAGDDYGRRPDSASGCTSLASRHHRRARSWREKLSADITRRGRVGIDRRRRSRIAPGDARITPSAL